MAKTFEHVDDIFHALSFGTICAALAGSAILALLA
jgi:hypothetical protein